MSNPKWLNDLVDDLSPARPLKALSLWGSVLVVLPLLFVVLVLSQGVRADLSEALQNGLAWWKGGSFAVLAIAMLCFVQSYSRPVPKQTAMGWVLVALAVGLFGAGAYGPLTAGDFFSLSSDALRNGTAAIDCFVSVMIGSLLAYAVLWRVWLRRAAPLSSRGFAFISAVACASLAAAVYSLHCPHDNPVYVLVFYGGSVLTMGGAGYLFASKTFEW